MKPIWIVGLGALVAIGLASSLFVLKSRAARAGTFEDYGVLPAFTLTNQRAEPFGTAQLEGKVWIANFIFTRCPTVCPLLTQKMAQVQERTASAGERVQLVSFSVDPDYDQPPVLQAYAQKHHADPARWTFLTGKPEALKKVIVDGLKQMMGREGPADDLNGIFHGTHFVLVDQHQHIRGYYRSEDPDVLERLSADALSLSQAVSSE